VESFYGITKLNIQIPEVESNRERKVGSKYTGKVVGGNQRLGSKVARLGHSSILDLICFEEFIFLETIFPTFPYLTTIRKTSQRNPNSGQRKIIHFKPGKCFPFFILRKTLSFPLFTKHVNVL